MTNTVTFHVGDVRDVMANMPDSSVDLPGLKHEHPDQVSLFAEEAV